MTHPVRRNEVMRVQQALQSRGLYHGAIDGLVGPMTEAGLRSFQRNADLPETSRIDNATAERLLAGER
jgi:peptidoglycan hydrolase-like protein with peptidoglycan-binding domain